MMRLYNFSWPSITMTLKLFRMMFLVSILSLVFPMIFILKENSVFKNRCYLTLRLISFMIFLKHQNKPHAHNCNNSVMKDKETKSKSPFFLHNWTLETEQWSSVLDVFWTWLKCLTSVVLNSKKMGGKESSRMEFINIIRSNHWISSF
jgi:Ca2+/H+ antiporter